MRSFITAAVIGLVTTFGSVQKARAYDIDCAIMLCMAGGFPPSAVCARAYRVMIRRITPWPSLPPFGICTYAAVQGDRHQPTVMDFILASIDRLAELGINKSAYNAAIDQMGDMATALCILIIDRNRFHPETPIKNPGGVLRAMTQRHGSGHLNLVGSLIGLSERVKVEDA